MAECTTKSLGFASPGRKKIEADFAGGQLTSDAGSLLLREVDKRIGLFDAIDSCIPDPRDPRYVQHSQRSMLAQRIMAKAQAHTISNKLLKVAAVIQVSTRRIIFHLASGYPYKELFVKLMAGLSRQPIPVFGFG